MMNIKALLMAATAGLCVAPVSGWAGGAGDYDKSTPPASVAPVLSQMQVQQQKTTVQSSATVTASPTVTAIGGTATVIVTPSNHTRGSRGAQGGGGVGSGGSPATAGPAAQTPVTAGQAVPLATGNSTNNVNAPPGFGLPAFGGGQCATVGFGIAVSPSGGGAFGPAWESTNCRNYYIAVTLIQAGRVDQGMQLLAMITPEAAQVMASLPASAATHAVDQHAIDLCSARPGWSVTQLAGRYSECKR